MTLKKILLSGLLVFLTACSFSSVDIKPTITEGLQPDKEIELAGEQGLTWSLEASEKFAEEYYVFDSVAQSSIKGVFSGDLFVLTPEKYNEFQNLQECKTCPANFLNSNATILLVLTEKKDVIDKLKSLKRGDKISLEGYDLSYGVYTKEGNEVNFNLDSKARPVYLNSIKVN